MRGIMKNKKREKIQGLLGDAQDYSFYDCTIKNRIAWFLIGFLVAAAVAFIFYENPIIMAIVGTIGGFAFIPIRRKQVIKKRKSTLLLQFKDLLDALSSSIGAGKNVYEAFSAAKPDLLVQYAADADIIKELDILIEGVNNNIKIEELLHNFAKRSGLNDIENFANVFSVCYEKGANIREVIRNTTTVITDKIEVEMELETMVAGQKNEQNIMLVMPIVFVFIMKTMGGGLIDLSSAIGVISVTISIVIFIAAYFVGKKILNIKL